MTKAPKTRKGAWSNKEKEYLRLNKDKTPLEEMAAFLGRDPETTRRFIEDNIGPLPSPAKSKPAPDAPRSDLERAEREEIREEFRKSLAWRKLKDEFDQDELAYFEEEYAELFRQFKGDVFKTEEQQIRKAITLDILMRRNMAARNKLREEIARQEKAREKAERELEKERESLTEEEREERETLLLSMETRLNASRSAEQAKTREWTDLDNRHQKLMEALKATRDQRISRVESSKRDWLGVLRDLADRERARREEELMRLMKEATGREHERLGRPHVYDDGREDRPILSAETVERKGRE